MGNHRARIRRTGHYSVANARQAWQIRDNSTAESGLDRCEAGSRNQPVAARGVSDLASHRRRGSCNRGSALEADGALHRLHELEVERVTSVARDDMGTDRTAEQREIAEQIQDLVTHELVVEAQPVQ